MTNYKYTEIPTLHNGRPGKPYETPHEISDIGLKGGALLHRFYIVDPESETGADPVPYSAIYIDGVEVLNDPRGREANLINEWNRYGAKLWEASKREERKKRYRKIAGCIYSHSDGCKGCAYNENPTLRDGGCMIAK